MIPRMRTILQLISFGPSQFAHFPLSFGYFPSPMHFAFLLFLYYFYSFFFGLARFQRPEYQLVLHVLQLSRHFSRIWCARVCVSNFLFQFSRIIRFKRFHFSSHYTWCNWLVRYYFLIIVVMAYVCVPRRSQLFALHCRIFILAQCTNFVCVWVSVYVDLFASCSSCFPSAPFIRNGLIIITKCEYLFSKYFSTPWHRPSEPAHKAREVSIGILSVFAVCSENTERERERGTVRIPPIHLWATWFLGPASPSKEIEGNGSRKNLFGYSQIFLPIANNTPSK